MSLTRILHTHILCVVGRVRVARSRRSSIDSTCASNTPVSLGTVLSYRHRCVGVNVNNVASQLCALEQFERCGEIVCELCELCIYVERLSIRDFQVGNMTRLWLSGYNTSRATVNMLRGVVVTFPIERVLKSGVRFQPFQ